MSYTPQGPGWWLASDGWWYPSSAQPGLDPARVPEQSDTPQLPPQTKSGPWVVAHLIAGIILLGGISAVIVPSTSGGSGSSWSAQSGVTVYGQPLTFLLTSFIDPAATINADSNSNDHYAVVHVSATNNGTSALAANLPVTIAAFGNDGKAHQWVSGSPVGNGLCPTTGSPSELRPTETAGYCLGFLLPENFMVTRIEVSGMVGGGSGSVGWNVTDTFPG
jgi:hypothetical protein